MLRALDAAYLEAASADHPEKNEPATKVSARPFELCGKVGDDGVR